jgi:hypothetical protein
MAVDQRRPRVRDGMAKDERALHENTSGACVLSAVSSGRSGRPRIVK